eukprot:scaffold2531_cov125-Isochrysis_galbana.AAC.2
MGRGRGSVRTARDRGVPPSRRYKRGFDSSDEKTKMKTEENRFAQVQSWVAYGARWAAGIGCIAIVIVGDVGWRVTGSSCRPQPTAPSDVLNALASRASGKVISNQCIGKLSLRKARSTKPLSYRGPQHPTCRELFIVANVRFDEGKWGVKWTIHTYFP